MANSSSISPATAKALVTTPALALVGSSASQWWKENYAALFAGACVGVMTQCVLGVSEWGDVMKAQHPALPYVTSLGLAGAATVLVSLGGSDKPKNQGKKISLRMGDLIWSRNAFCRGWLATGTTGSGKTEFIKVLMHLLCRNEVGKKEKDGTYKRENAPWGGLCIDEKGFFQEEVLGVLDNYGRRDDVVVLETRPDDAPMGWEPKYRFNVLGDERVTTSQYVDAILRTATTVSGGEGDKGFFKTQAGLHIGAAIDLYRAIREQQIKLKWDRARWVAPTLRNVYEILTDKIQYDNLLKKVNLIREKREVTTSREPDGEIKREEKVLWVYNFEELDSPQLRRCIDHFQTRYWGVKAQEQLEGVKGTIVNYLHWFTEDEVSEIFCCEDADFRIDVMDFGKIICLSMPMKHAIQRRYVCALMKLLAYSHGKSRNPLKYRYNLLIIWQDEAQRFIQEADGDVDILRQFQMTTVLSTQSKSSLYVPLGGRDKAIPILLNLRNRVILRAADEECAEESAKFIGKAVRVKKTKSVSSQGTSWNYSEEIGFIHEPYQIRNMPDFVAIVCHAEGKKRIYESAPMDAKGRVPDWYEGKTPQMRRRLALVRRGFAVPFVPTKLQKVFVTD